MGCVVELPVVTGPREFVPREFDDVYWIFEPDDDDAGWIVVLPKTTDP